MVQQETTRDKETGMTLFQKPISIPILREDTLSTEIMEWVPSPAADVSPQLTITLCGDRMSFADQLLFTRRLSFRHR